MRILFVADGRSPISLNWIRHFTDQHEVYLASTFPCETDLPIKGLDLVPVAFSGMKRSGAAPSSGPSTLGLRTVMRQWLGPLTISRSADRLRAVIERVQPDLIHALRIPYEGMLAADASVANADVPLIVSVWGNDFTLHAPSTPLMGHYTRWTMRVADALHADCQRDIHLAHRWGLAVKKPTLVTPGNGGIRPEIFHPAEKPVEAPVILNPRGFRAYVRNDAFFQAIPLVLAQKPEARFLCTSMAGEAQALRWIRELNIGHAVELLAPLPHDQMGDIFRRAQVLVSPSVHDGTPNTLLEGMACGCFPVAGDLESIREWINPGENGLLVDATDSRALADAILAALQNKNLRDQAAGRNAQLIAERGEYETNMKRAEEFYERVRRKG